MIEIHVQTLELSPSWRAKPAILLPPCIDLLIPKSAWALQQAKNR